MLSSSKFDFNPNREDASIYNIHQLQTIMKLDKFRFDYFLDLILCNNEIIFKILSIKVYLIPLVKRHTAK